MDGQLGKIAHTFFDQLVKTRLGASRQDVIAGPQFGVDVSLIDLSEGNALVLASDPLSLIPSLGLEESAWLSVHLLANDIATTGFAPQFGQFVLNLPAGFPKADFDLYWDYIHRFSQEIGLAITGGHTGFVEGQNSTIAGGATFATIAPKEKIKLSKNAQLGDSILVTKSAAVSAVAILARSFPVTVKNKAGNEIFHAAAGSFDQLSSLKDALLAVGSPQAAADVSAMHDVTEGGILGAIYEMVVASGLGAKIYNEKLPIHDVQQQVSQLFDLDPRYIVGAGSMIISVPQAKATSVIQRLASGNIPCVEVGRIGKKDEGIKLIEGGTEKELIYHAEDPYWAAFFNALKSGWK